MRQRSYLMGFIYSLVLTIAAYLLATRTSTHGSVLITGLLALAAVQLYVQLHYFLDFGYESEPRWRQTALFFMIVIVGILVTGTIWIMKSLDYNHLNQPSDTSIIKDEGAHQ